MAPHDRITPLKAMSIHFVFTSSFQVVTVCMAFVYSALAKARLTYAMCMYNSSCCLNGHLYYLANKYNPVHQISDGH